MELNYEYYKNEYLGTLIPDEITFKKALKLAQNYVLSRINKTYIPKEAFDCVCAIAEENYKFDSTDDVNSDIVSESIGSWSVTYAKSKAQSFSAKKYEILQNYLLHTGLLYCGL